jgi:hypothetical protein
MRVKKPASAGPGVRQFVDDSCYRDYDEQLTDIASAFQGKLGKLALPM